MMLQNHILPVGARPFNNAYIVNVTPELAQRWLSYNRFNRPIDQTIVAQYVRQIKVGLWKRTHQGVAFTLDGALLDGQHRLLAIIQSGQTMPMLVFINESLENYEYIDSGRKRSNLDMVRLGQHDGTIDSMHVQTLKAFLAGRNCRTRNRWTNPELNLAFQQHGQSICFAVDLFRGYKHKAVNDHTVRGLIARARYTVPDERLMDFATYLLQSNGIGSDPISAFVQCIRACHDRRESTRREIYHSCQKSLVEFLHGHDAVKELTTTPDMFPVSGLADNQ